MSTINIKQLFNDVLKKGKPYHSHHLSLRALCVSNVEKSNFYFVVSGKIIKKAVKRNLFKRRGRYITRSVKTKYGYIAVFFAKKGVGTLSFEQTKVEILDLMEKAGILN